MRQTVIVADDFYTDFEAARGTALAAEYEPHANGNYPGRNSLRPWITQEALRKLEFVAGSKLEQRGVGTAHFRSTRADDEKKALDIHTDNSQLSAIVYLNTAAQCEGRVATCFWRHLRTGLEDVPSPDDKDRIYREVLIPDSRDTQDASKWQLQMSIPMVPNRLLLFRSNLFHSPADAFGHDLETSRLIQVFFLYRKRP